MIIIRDTREHAGFEWSFGEIETRDKKIFPGDYTMEGYEGVVAIERKKSPSEIAINIGTDWKRFEKELIALSKIPFSYIICEFSLTEAMAFPMGSDIPKSKLSKIKIGGKYLVKTLNSFEETFNVKVIYAGNRETAIEKTIDIFDTIIEINGEYE